MKITISNQAQNWFKEEMGLTKGEQVKFYVQMYGNSPVQKGYSLAFTKEDPIHEYVSAEVDGILFFVEEPDLWFFNEHDLFVDFDHEADEIVYKYV